MIAEGRQDGAAEQSAALDAIEKELHEAGHFWGSDANAIVIVGGEENKHHTSTVIAASVMADDDFPHAGLLVDEMHSGVATSVFQGTSDLKVGTRMKYVVGDPYNREAG